MVLGPISFSDLREQIRLGPNCVFTQGHSFLDVGHLWPVDPPSVWTPSPRPPSSSLFHSKKTTLGPKIRQCFTLSPNISLFSFLFGRLLVELWWCGVFEGRAKAHQTSRVVLLLRVATFQACHPTGSHPSRPNTLRARSTLSSTLAVIEHHQNWPNSGGTVAEVENPKLAEIEIKLKLTEVEMGLRLRSSSHQRVLRFNTFFVKYQFVTSSPTRNHTEHFCLNNQLWFTNQSAPLP